MAIGGTAPFGCKTAGNPCGKQFAIRGAAAVLTYPSLVNGVAVRYFKTTTPKQQIEEPQNHKPDASLVDDSNAPLGWTTSCAVVYKNVITDEEAEAISNEILSNRMRRRRYEKGHWDSVITKFREIELFDLHQMMMEGIHNDDSDDSSSSTALILRAFQRIRNHLAHNHLRDVYTNDEQWNWLPCHAIDLKKDGQLNAHVDSVRFSGHLVAGLSLLSPAIMRLRHPPPPDEHDKEQEEQSSLLSDDNDAGHIDLLLPPKSLYVLQGFARYECSHELLPDKSVFDASLQTITVSRDQRLSIIFRDAKQEI